MGKKIVAPEVTNMAEKKEEIIKTLVINCCDCGRTFSVPPSEQKFFKSRQLEMPKRCAGCREKRKRFEEKVCVDCGATFALRDTEKAFYENAGLAAPQRCHSCREIKRERNVEVQEASCTEN